MMDDLRFKEGDEVIVLGHGWGHPRPTLAKVFKVYKTGNFILRQGGQQYKQNGDAAGEYTYHSSTVEPFDAKTFAEYEKPHRLKRIDKKVKTAVDDLDYDSDKDLIARIYAILSEAGKDV